MTFFYQIFLWCELLWNIAMESTQWRSCTCFPIWLVAGIFQCNPTMKLSNVNGMCVSSWRFATSLGPWVNVSSMWIIGRVDVVWGLGYQLEKFTRRWRQFLRHLSSSWWTTEVRVVKEKLGTSCWPAYIGTCNRIMTLLTEWPVGENEEIYIDGLDANDIQTDTVTQPVWAIAVFRGMILTFIPLWMERYKCDSSLQQFDFWSSWCFELDLS